MYLQILLNLYTFIRKCDEFYLMKQIELALNSMYTYNVYTYYFLGVFLMDIEKILGYLLNTSARLIKHDMEKQLIDFDITTAQWAVLKLLDSWGELTQTEIADKLKSDKATVGFIVAR
ncbi:MarR family protein [Sporolactobacillus nakayamae]|uniref:MarR family protein n=2 Tax=Sporolactobacillus nakayamae TaxID=269670 RepID=A0A1I2V3I3_9BACL|nr:MarR family protein [Sporolactobacillus nakayamae]